MSTQRYISTSFWDDEWVQSLDPSEKLLFMYFMTNPLTNIAGVYKISDRRISFDTGFNIETIQRIVKKFESAKKVFRHNEYIIIRNWCKHQKWESSEKIKKGIISILQELGKEMIDYLAEIAFFFDLTIIDKTVIARKMRKLYSGTTIKAVYDKCENKCIGCGSFENLEMHHKLPLENGGTNSVDNLELLCHECHVKSHKNLSTYPISYSDLNSDIDIDIDLNSDTAPAPAGGKKTIPNNYEKQVFNTLTETNNSVDKSQRIPISTDFWTFINKDMRVINETAMRENQLALVVEAIKNLCLVMKIPKKDTWVNNFSINFFCKKFTEFLPEYFDIQKYMRAKSTKEIETENKLRTENRNKSVWDDSRAVSGLPDFNIAFFDQHYENWIDSGKPAENYIAWVKKIQESEK